MKKPKITRTRGIPIPITPEDYSDYYNQFPFVTLITYRNEVLLTIVDNSTPKQIKAYVIDYCETQHIEYDYFFDIVSNWFEHKKDLYPLSIEFSRLGLHKMSKVYKTLSCDYVTRLIGPFPSFNMSEVQSTKKRKRKILPPEIQIRKR